MEQMEFFKSELSLAKCGYLDAISKSDEALNELFIEAQKTDKVPNLRLYVNSIVKPRFNENENAIGLYSPRYERAFNYLQDRFFRNYETIDKKYHYWNVGATSTVKNLAELETLVSELEKDNVIKSKFFDKDARFKIISHIYLKLPPCTRKVIFDEISDYERIRKLGEVFRIMGLKEKDVSNQTELRISLINYLSVLNINKNDYFGIATDLSGYVGDTTDEVITTIIKHKRLPFGVDKLLWLKGKNDAVVFCDVADVKISEWNKCFNLLDGKKLVYGNRTKDPYKDYEIEKILNKYLK